MSVEPAIPSIVAITYEYTEAVDVLLVRIARRLKDAGLRLTGFVQHDEPREDRAKCDMVLEELSGGDRFRISEDRGRHARGCRLNADWLLKASTVVRGTLFEGPDALVLNKYGKVEAEGGGFRDLIALSLELGVPILIAVPCRNLDSWRAYAGGMSMDLRFSDDPAFVDRVCGFFAPKFGIVAAAATRDDAVRPD